MVTLSTNYKETLKSETVTTIDELLEDYNINFGLDEILEFIDEYGEENINYFADYDYLVHNIHAFGREQEVIDAYINDSLGSISYIDSIDVDAYCGQFDDKEDFITQYELVDIDIPRWLVIDYDATWECNVRHDYSWNEETNDVWRNH
tara:strand:- start:778 stop:1221 length:444 start_codon:yes stop_codon:yes gene_type:complete